MKGFYREGWVCPKCGAVMSPYCDMCKNCTGKMIQTQHYIPGTTDINTVPEIDINKFKTTVSIIGKDN